jgi:hypothetical protein
MSYWDKDSDSYLDAVVDAKIDREMEGFDDFCQENDLDPEDEDSLDSFKDGKEYSEDPYKYYGVKRSDF